MKKQNKLSIKVRRFWTWNQPAAAAELGSDQRADRTEKQLKQTQKRKLDARFHAAVK